jgi:hypothetical protein
MTKYILHGGNTSVKSKENRQFFCEILKDAPDPANLLLVYFAREDEEWVKSIEQDKENFTNANPGKKINFSLAKRNIFADQAKTADAIYLRGGDGASKLKEPLSQAKDLKKVFAKKTIAGSSDGAYVLAEYYYSNDRQNLFEGLGILPIKVICHYSEDKKDRLEKLKKHGKELKTYALEEEKFVVIHK